MNDFKQTVSYYRDTFDNESLGRIEDTSPPDAGEEVRVVVDGKTTKVIVYERRLTLMVNHFTKTVTHHWAILLKKE